MGHPYGVARYPTRPVQLQRFTFASPVDGGLTRTLGCFGLEKTRGKRHPCPEISHWKINNRRLRSIPSEHVLRTHRTDLAKDAARHRRVARQLVNGLPKLEKRGILDETVLVHLICALDLPKVVERLSLQNERSSAPQLDNGGV
jgi:hypothetical protein